MQEGVTNTNKKIVTRETIFNILKEEYEKGSQKNGKEKTAKKVNMDTLGFADITVWFYKRNCQQGLEEAKYIWELLPANPMQRHTVDEYLEVYAKEIIDKHNKFSLNHSKYRRLENILNRTHALIQSLNEIFTELNLNPESEDSRASNLDDQVNSSEKFEFIIHLKSIEGHDLTPVFQRSDFLGHHIEIGYKDQIVMTESEMTEGNQIDFQDKTLEFEFSLKEGSVFIHLYEDYLTEGGTIKKLVAQRNLDLFTNVNQKFLNDLLAFDQEVARLDEVKYDLYHLKKFVTEDPNSRYGDQEDNFKENYAKLKMSIHIAGFTGCNDLFFFFKQLQKRKAFLEDKIKSVKMKASGYKQKLMLLLLPFNNILSFNEKNIIIKEAPERHRTSGTTCNLF